MSQSFPQRGGARGLPGKPFRQNFQNRASKTSNAVGGRVFQGRRTKQNLVDCIKELEKDRKRSLASIFDDINKLYSVETKTVDLSADALRKIHSKIDLSRSENVSNVFYCLTEMGYLIDRLIFDNHTAIDFQSLKAALSTFKPLKAISCKNVKNLSQMDTLDAFKKSELKELWIENTPLFNSPFDDDQLYQILPSLDVFNGKQTARANFNNVFLSSSIPIQPQKVFCEQPNNSMIIKAIQEMTSRNDNILNSYSETATFSLTFTKSHGVSVPSELFCLSRNLISRTKTEQRMSLLKQKKNEIKEIFNLLMKSFSFSNEYFDILFTGSICTVVMGGIVILNNADKKTAHNFSRTLALTANNNKLFVENDMLTVDLCARNVIQNVDSVLLNQLQLEFKDLTRGQIEQALTKSENDITKARQILMFGKG